MSVVTFRDVFKDPVGAVASDQVKAMLRHPYGLKVKKDGTALSHALIYILEERGDGMLASIPQALHFIEKNKIQLNHFDFSVFEKYQGDPALCSKIKQIMYSTEIGVDKEDKEKVIKFFQVLHSSETPKVAIQNKFLLSLCRHVHHNSSVDFGVTFKTTSDLKNFISFTNADIMGHFSTWSDDHVFQKIKILSKNTGIQEERFASLVLQSCRKKLNSYSSYMVDEKFFEKLISTYPDIARPSDIKKLIILSQKPEYISRLNEPDQVSFIFSCMKSNLTMLEKISFHVSPEIIVKCYAQFFDKFIQTPNCRAIWHKHLMLEGIQDNIESSSDRPQQKRKM